MRLVSIELEMPLGHSGGKAHLAEVQRSAKLCPVPRSEECSSKTALNVPKVIQGRLFRCEPDPKGLLSPVLHTARVTKTKQKEEKFLICVQW